MIKTNKKLSNPANFITIPCPGQAVSSLLICPKKEFRDGDGRKYNSSYATSNDELNSGVTPENVTNVTCGNTIDNYVEGKTGVQATANENNTLTLTCDSGYTIQNASGKFSASGTTTTMDMDKLGNEANGKNTFSKVLKIYRDETTCKKKGLKNKCTTTEVDKDISMSSAKDGMPGKVKTARVSYDCLATYALTK